MAREDYNYTVYINIFLKYVYIRLDGNIHFLNNFCTSKYRNENLRREKN